MERTESPWPLKRRTISKTRSGSSGKRMESTCSTISTAARTSSSIDRILDFWTFDSSQRQTQDCWNSFAYDSSASLRDSIHHVLYTKKGSSYDRTCPGCIVSYIFTNEHYKCRTEEDTCEKRKRASEDDASMTIGDYHGITFPSPNARGASRTRCL